MTKIAAKIQRDTVSFKPVPYTLTKSRRGTITVTSPEIKWECLTDDQVRTQWGVCTNQLWFQEKEGKISRKDLEPVFYEYLPKIGFTKKEISSIRKLKESQISFHLLSIAYLLSTGAKNKESTKFLQDGVEKLINLSEEIEEVSGLETPKIDPEVLYKRKLSWVLGELEGMYDDGNYDFLKFLQFNKVPKSVLDDVQEYYKPRLQELYDVQDNKDAQLKEAYSRYTKKEIQNLVNAYEQVILDADSFRKVKTVIRKVKPKTPAKLVAKLNYLEYTETLYSINPEKIIGATALWVYNVKTRKLGVYNASEHDKELTVKGSTILGWDPNTSVAKRLRKPDEQLHAFLGSGKVAQKNFLKNVKTTESELTGRINKDTILLKVH